MSRHTAPSPDRVRQMYDQMPLTHDPVNGVTYPIHFGYWADGDHSSWLDAANKLTDVLIEKIALRPGQHLLDVGCGTGQPAERIARAAGVQVTGITVSPTQVDVASRHANAAGLADQVRFERANMMRLPYTDGRFDGAWAIESLIHVPDPLSALREINRVLLPTGRLVIADVTRRRALTASQNAVWTAWDCVLRTEDELLDLVRDAGFGSVECDDVTERTYRSRVELRDRFTAHRNDSAAYYGPEVADEMAAVVGQDDFLDNVGYVIIRAGHSGQRRR